MQTILLSKCTQDTRYMTRVNFLDLQDTTLSLTLTTTCTLKFGPSFLFGNIERLE